MSKKSRVDVDEQNGILQIRLNLFFSYMDAGSISTGLARAKAGINLSVHKRLLELSSEYKKYLYFRRDGMHLRKPRGQIDI